MRKKLLSILALLCLTVTSAWAQEGTLLTTILSTDNAGFTSGTPWFQINANYTEINAAAQEDDPNSLLNFYRRLIAFRKHSRVALWGDYRELCEKSRDFYVYERRLDSERLLVICSFSSELKRFEPPEDMDLEQWSLVLCNYDNPFVIARGFTARPYELRVYRLGGESV